MNQVPIRGSKPRSGQLVFCLAGTIVALSGCGRVEPDSKSIRTDFVRNLGVVLADGQTLSQSISVENPLRRKIAIKNVTAMVPCCSSVGSAPTEIGPGQSGEFVLNYRTSGKLGIKRVDFSAETDSATIPRFRLVLIVDERPGWEVERLGSSVDRVPLGEAFRGEYLVTLRGRTGDRDLLPFGVTASEGMTAWLEGSDGHPPRVDAGITEETRRLRVEAPGSKTPGYHAAAVRFAWNDGRSKAHAVRWEVSPRLSVAPQGLVLPRSKSRTDVTVVISTSGEPFRIKDVYGPCLAEAPITPRASGKRHVIHLAVAPDKLAGDNLSEVEIITDDPIQPTVRLSVLFTGSEDPEKREAKHDGF